MPNGFTHQQQGMFGYGPFAHPKPDFDKYLKPSSIPVIPRYWDQETDYHQLIKLPRTGDVNTSLKMKRNLVDGTVDMYQYEEVRALIKIPFETNRLLPNTSMSVHRAPSSHQDFVRGTSTSYPLAPGN